MSEIKRNSNNSEFIEIKRKIDKCREEIQTRELEITLLKELLCNACEHKWELTYRSKVKRCSECHMYSQNEFKRKR